MQRLAFLPLSMALFAGACASSGGPWPSLAYRPGEHAAGDPCDPGAIAMPGAPSQTVASAPPPPVPSPVPPPPAADLDELARQLAAGKAAWQVQREKTEAAVAAAVGLDAGDVRWTSAQLELSRLDAIGSGFGDIAERLEPGSGEVMTASQQSLLEQADAAKQAHLKLFKALRTRLSEASGND